MIGILAKLGVYRTTIIKITEVRGFICIIKTGYNPYFPEVTISIQNFGYAFMGFSFVGFVFVYNLSFSFVYLLMKNNTLFY